MTDKNKGIKTIGILGRGNLAHHLRKILLKNGFEVIQLWHRGEKIETADLYFVCVPSETIAEVVSLLPFDAKWVHTDANFDETIFANPNKAMLYPFMTFSKDVPVDWADIPITVASSNKDFEQEIVAIARKISSKVNIFSREDLKYLHLSAVFACNFVNYLWIVAEKILSSQNIDFKAVIPLIEKSLDKIKQQSPKLSQTGPAVRHDFQTLVKQLELTPEDEQDIYKMLTGKIEAFGE